MRRYKEIMSPPKGKPNMFEIKQKLDRSRQNIFLLPSYILHHLIQEEE